MPPPGRQLPFPNRTLYLFIGPQGGICGLSPRWELVSTAPQLCSTLAPPARAWKPSLRRHRSCRFNLMTPVDAKACKTNLATGLRTPDCPAGPCPGNPADGASPGIEVVR